jgi:hypothetical protein
MLDAGQEVVWMIAELWFRVLLGDGIPDIRFERKLSVRPVYQLLIGGAHNILLSVQNATHP